MTCSRTKWVALAISMGALLSAASAQTSKDAPGERVRALFQRLDKNHDGAVEKNEVPENARPAFESLLKRGDANGDGKLEAGELRKVAADLREFAAQARAKAEQRFKALDKNRDGKIERAEFNGKKARFDQLDRDENGSLSRQELINGMFGPSVAAGPTKENKKAVKGDGAKKAKTQGKKKPQSKKDDAPGLKEKKKPEASS